MGEPSACLVRSFSQPPGTSCEGKEGDPLRALTTSISFGRFMSESLAWEKWSSFTHNRHLEEVEKFSKPGSVAQKKAYFEAHYKRIAAKKAAALLQQENAAASDSPEPIMTDEIHNNSSTESELAESYSHVATDETQRKEAPNTELVFSVDANGCDLTVEGKELETAQVEGAEPVIEKLVIAENPIQVELSDQLENVENHSKIMSIQEEKTPIKDPVNRRDLPLLSKKKPTIYSSKSSTYSGASKLRAPVKLTTPVHPRKEDNVTPKSKTARDSMDKKRSTPKSVHMSINFASRAGETSKTYSPVLNKIGNIRPFTKTSKDSSTQRTPTRASVNEVSKHPSKTPQPENRRTRTLLDRSVSGSRTVNGKSQSLSMNLSESLSACGSKARSPIVCSSFTFRSEERAAKRKEKLEEKLNAKEAEKVKLQFKEKAKNDIKKMRQSIGFKAEPISIFYRETESPSNHMKKIPPTRPRSPKLGRKPTPSMAQDISSRPVWRPPFKTDGSKYVTEKNNRTLNPSVNSLPRKNMHENTSPNIQL